MLKFIDLFGYFGGFHLALNEASSEIDSKKIIESKKINIKKDSKIESKNIDFNIDSKIITESKTIKKINSKNTNKFIESKKIDSVNSIQNKKYNLDSKKVDFSNKDSNNIESKKNIESNISCLFASEIELNAQKTYSLNFPKTPLFGDITLTQTQEKIPKDFDILCGGFPCQAFSIAGYQKGFEDTRGTLFFEIAKIAKEHKPKVLFLENVKNLKNHNNGKTYEIIESTLKNLGYEVFSEILHILKLRFYVLKYRI
ncbi:DNA (cytosine-5-)-methyltransferase [Helicobacter saguini]|uniref:Cytosine-specific methyltransferase n=1 Tax=Helicobacter saguini TaxID=1548018 RepID=A0A347VHU2_9HELI|nr:DNA (cytosine-5-)-methyltransferase [Helicobacter saguini]MWV62426.1 DNA (cytosine-5-)-methyltransferase [Helicobacter saguini]MWV66902.1 DNA (cytosine-5-)-methyltransferase [Helicobacter saguini]MWV69251.1 DNA (cytosine-5-)-methyltransferase [Helicobacter saguini]MWV71194.1 DNA (cytosine-5-)-methyltransferase [Helicobacter saguini]TLD93326.1 DNA (cytosine-5-)-methyltransferase [Helicobacter saguini]